MTIGYNSGGRPYPFKVATDEQPPRVLTIKGTSALDPDVWVAEDETTGESGIWIVKGSGYICCKTGFWRSSETTRHYAVRFADDVELDTPFAPI